MQQQTNISLFFGGTAYLGMPHNEEFRKLFIRGMEIYGVNHGASRNNNITLDIFSIAENAAAKRFGAGDSILVSSGYLSAQLVVQNYSPSHELIYAPETHPALWPGISNPPKMKFSDWAEQTVHRVNSSSEPCMIISNSVNNLIPEIYDFSWLKKIDPSRNPVLLVDDSHGIGITGENGEGVFKRLPDLVNIKTIVISSLAKALGTDAGIILSDIDTIQELRNTPVYAGSSPPSPGALFAFTNAGSIYSNELKKLRHNLRLFTDLLISKEKLFFIPDFPVFLVPDDQLAIHLSKNGINFSSFPYPDPKGKSLHRIVISSIHTAEELGILANLINDFKS
ncbi:aminotransferase class I/II-fold pyridoxal phosphate-dependent enzyme [Daejeonella sp. H1SJ63]|uniref:aminotransferase class I/II-fold pyridoxal phosphate-dependent enzyme n=1 Tax=Daejeonella sp. H1SJ63 TaxID=3034145 RepID=UPI0023ECE0B9|nr:aminotransferase class I/II-fold pyridoxal phosphate-dependent enzyme [Daejeonella sp. H1SJ63]